MFDMWSVGIDLWKVLILLLFILSFLMVFMNPGNRVWRYLISLTLFLMSYSIIPE